MNRLIYIILIVALFSCKSNSIAQEKDSIKTYKPKIEKPKFGDPRDNEITHFGITSHNRLAPNTVHLVAITRGINKGTTICGKNYKATATIKVKRIIGSGSGIVNLIAAGQEITLAFRNAGVKDFDTLQQRFSKDQEVTLIVNEVPCTDMSKTVYIVLSVKAKKL